MEYFDNYDSCNHYYEIYNKKFSKDEYVQYSVKVLYYNNFELYKSFTLGTLSHMYRNKPSSKILSLEGCTKKDVCYGTYYEWYNNGKLLYPSMSGIYVETIEKIE